MRDHFKPTRVTVFEVTDGNASVGKHTEELEPSRPAGGDANTEWFGHFSESYTFPYHRTHDFIPRNLPKRNESMCPNTKTRTQTSTVASFETARVEMTSVASNLLMRK